MRKVVRGLVTLATAAAVMAVSAGNAFAESSGYNSGGVAGGQSGGNLPFTGSELVLYVIVGLAIVASGFALRALSARRSES